MTRHRSSRQHSRHYADALAQRAGAALAATPEHQRCLDRELRPVISLDGKNGARLTATQHDDGGARRAALLDDEPIITAAHRE